MEEKRNPYFFSGMVQHMENFYGRKAELQRIFALLGGAQPMSVSVVGPRRIGKTSLLYYICRKGQERLGSEWRFGYVGLDSLGDLTVPRLLRAMATALGERQSEGSYEEFSALVDNRVKQGQRLVLCLDEFEAAGQLGSDFLGYLRGLVSTNRAALVVATERPLEELSQEGVLTSPFYNVFTPVPLGPMPEDEARELLTQRGTMPFSAEEVDAALRKAGGNPFLLQQLGYQLYEKHYGSGVTPLVPTKPGVPSARRFLPSPSLEWAAVGYALAFFSFLLAGFLPANWSVVGYAVSILLALAASLLFGDYMISRSSLSGGRTR